MNDGLDSMRVSTVITGAAILLVPLVDAAIRLATPGWILAFVFLYGAPIWMLVYAALIWMACGLFSSTSSFAEAPRTPRAIVLTLLWVYLAGLTFFCWFMSDGGDADDWQSPASLLLGVDGYNSSTPEYLNRAQELAVPALLIGLAAVLAAMIGYGVVVWRQRRRNRAYPTVAGAEVRP